MFLIVNLNPAIDRIYTLEDFQVNKIHRTRNVFFQAGGKGINVARAAKVMRGDCFLTGMIGGHSASFLFNNLNDSGIKNDFSITTFETRTCIILIDETNSTQTVINEDGPELIDSDINNFIKKFKELIPQYKLLVLSGSLPHTTIREIYNELVILAKEYNVRTIVDTSNMPLKKVLNAKPFMIKPNIFEFADLFDDRSIVNEPMNNRFDNLIPLVDKLIANGIENITISLGELGAIYFNKDVIYRVEAPKIECVNAVASGDAMTAAMAMELCNGVSIEEALISGVAAGSANATIGGLRFTYEQFKHLRDNIEGYYIERI